MNNGNLIIIGDVHGKVNEYWKILQNHKGESIQLGDFGFKKQHEWHIKNIDSNKHRISFGNHDDTSYLLEPHSFGNWNYREDYGLMTIRGAFSIDKNDRVSGIDWWPNEEMNYHEMNFCINDYEKHKPIIVISHDCPHKIANILFGNINKSLTSNGLNEMFEIHKPDLWIFGHHHKSRNEIIDGTRFICLSELETFII